MGRKFAILSLALLLCCTAPAQIIQSDCTSTVSLDSLFKNNAAKLAITTEAKRTTDTTTLPFDPFTPLADTINKGLWAIYNSGLVEIDNLFKGVKLTPLFVKVPMLNEITISLLLKDTNTTTKQWFDSVFYNKKLIPLSTVADSVFTHYGFLVSDTISLLPVYRQIRLKSIKSVNPFPLAKLLETRLPGVEWIRPFEFNLDYETNIRFSRKPLHDEYIFWTGWGDCPLGCHYLREWKFLVYDSCKIEFSGSSGANVGIKKITKSNLTAFPNPTGDFVKFEGNGAFAVDGIEILDVTGKTIKTIEVKHLSAREIEISTSDLAPGIYLFRILQDDYQQVIRLVKN